MIAWTSPGSCNEKETFPMIHFPKIATVARFNLEWLTDDKDSMSRK